MINEQEGLYTLFLRGFENGKKVNDKRVISCVSRCLKSLSGLRRRSRLCRESDLRLIACNTTEAGITYDPACSFTDVPADSYPGKADPVLIRGFETFGKEAGKGFLSFLSCELIDNNGKELEKCVLQYADQWEIRRRIHHLDQTGEYLLLHFSRPDRNRLSEK